MEVVGLVLVVARLALVLIALLLLVDAVRRPADAFVAAERQTKNLWVGLLAAAVAAPLLLPGFVLFLLAGLVVVGVYGLDVRPALSGATGPGW